MKYPLLVFFFLEFLFSTSSAQTVVEVDTIIQNGTINNRINLVFLGDGYTSSQQSKFITDVNSIVNKLFMQEPFNRYCSFFNVYAIKIASVDSGADHAHTAGDCGSANPAVPTVNVNTMLGAQFDYGGVHRLLYCTNTININSILQTYTPYYDKALIIVNTPYYGGSGGNFPTCSADTNSAEIMIHELGHSFAGLGDEYGGTICGGMEKPNCTQETNPFLIKWKDWFTVAISIPTQSGINCSDVGLYQGANYCNNNWYRPMCDCKMKLLNKPFCKICKQEFVYSISNAINLIETTSPTNSNLTLINGQSQLFSASTINPIPNSLLITWTLNNVVHAVWTNTFLITATALPEGIHTLKISVIDSTSWSKKQMTEYSFEWTIEKIGPAITLSYFNQVCSNEPAFALTGGEPTGGTYNGTGVSNGSFFPSLAGAGTHSISYNFNGVSVVSSIAVVAKPIIYISGNDTVCTGSSAILTAIGATVYAWVPSIGLNATTGNNITATPSTTQVYTVTGSTDGCVDSQTIMVFVNPMPILNVSGANSICVGSSTVLTASDAAIYSWSPTTGLNASSSEQVNASPIINTTYTITGTSNGCQSSTTKFLTVNISPEIYSTLATTSCSNSNDGSIGLFIEPLGQQLTYLWSNGNTLNELQNISSGIYSVTVTNAFGCSATKIDTVLKPDCIGIQGISIGSISMNSATINWNLNPCAAKLIYRRRELSATVWNYFEINGIDISVTDINLISGKTYEFQLMSFCDSAKTDSSGYSSSYYFTNLGICVVPDILISSPVVSTSATLTWNADSSSVYYKLFYRIENGILNTVNVPPLQNHFTLNNLMPNSNYQWAVQSICNLVDSISILSSMQNFTTTTATATEVLEPIAFSELKVFPNPTNNKIWIIKSAELKGKTYLTLRDVFGKTIDKKNIPESKELNTEFDLSRLAVGTYLLQIQCNEGNFIYKIIKQ